MKNDRYSKVICDSHYKIVNEITRNSDTALRRYNLPRVPPEKFYNNIVIIHRYKFIFLWKKYQDIKYIKYITQN